MLEYRCNRWVFRVATAIKDCRKPPPVATHHDSGNNDSAPIPCGLPADRLPSDRNRDSVALPSSVDGARGATE
jgi:hypothetical protein